MAAKLHAAGWAGISWPKEYGGRGATLIEQAIFVGEAARQEAPSPANVLGLAMGGPVVIAHGTDAQKQRYLEPILTGEEIWCQGFSEPESGSDLASLKTRAVKDGDEWVVTGQKVWTTFAQYAKWCMLVARTDPDAPKHKGLTYFLMDMEQEGVEAKPLVQITGEGEFNEVFINEARIPDENVVGGVGNGWGGGDHDADERARRPRLRRDRPDPEQPQPARRRWPSEVRVNGGCSRPRTPTTASGSPSSTSRRRRCGSTPTAA